MKEPDHFQTAASQNAANHSGQSRFAPGQIVAERYRIDSVLGTGGMGVVYKVEQIFLRKFFAMKTMEMEDATDLFWRRFQQEAAAAGRLDHPNVVKIHDFNLINGKMPFYVMDLVGGTSLAALLKQHGALDTDDALKIFIRVSMALQHAHEAEVVHRDIKPSNIMLQNRDFASDTCVKLVDFGIAKLQTEGNELQNLTRTGEIFGSPLYMSPEQCLGTGVDNRTDIYSFGCALYESLTGSPPHVGENSLSTMIKHREQSASSLTDGSLGKKFPPALEDVVQQLLRKDPNERYQNFRDVTEDLIALANGKKPTHVKATKSNIVQPTAASRQSSSKAWWLLPLSGLILISAFAWYALKSTPKPPTVTKPVITTTMTAPVAKQPSVTTISPELQELYDKELLQPKSEIQRSYGGEIPYSVECLDSANRKIRVFQFPNEISLGTLAINHHNFKAQGDVIVTDPGPMSLTASFACCERPTLLEKFRPDEIDALIVDGLDSAVDEVLSHLNKWTALKMLNIKNTEITNKGLSYLSDSPSLLDLRVTNAQVTGKGIAALKCLNRLEEIDADMMAGTDDLLRALKNSRRLRHLNVWRAKLSDDDLKNLRQITSLKILDISENKKITDKGIEYLALPQLTSLSVKHCNVTEECFPFLKTLPSLSNVFIAPDWSATKQAFFKKTVPKVQLIIESESHHYF